jgi:hypothetical protein
MKKEKRKRKRTKFGYQKPLRREKIRKDIRKKEKKGEKKIRKKKKLTFMPLGVKGAGLWLKHAEAAAEDKERTKTHKRERSRYVRDMTMKQNQK